VHLEAVLAGDVFCPAMLMLERLGYNYHCSDDIHVYVKILIKWDGNCLLQEEAWPCSGRGRPRLLRARPKGTLERICNKVDIGWTFKT
jgi:hypothetical protein